MPRGPVEACTLLVGDEPRDLVVADPLGPATAKAAPYRAVPVDTPEAIDKVTRLMGKGSSGGYWVGRVMLLWAPIKPVRLDPRTAAS